jgi:hypothetical protein
MFYELRIQKTMKTKILGLAIGMALCLTRAHADTINGTSLAGLPLSADNPPDIGASAVYSSSPPSITITSGNQVSYPAGCNSNSNCYNAFLDTGEIILPSSLVSGGYGSLDTFLSSASSSSPTFTASSGGSNVYWDLKLTDAAGSTIIVNGDGGVATLDSSADAYGFIVTGGVNALDWCGDVNGTTTTFSTFAGENLNTSGLCSSPSSLTGSTDTTPFGSYTVEALTLDVGGYANNTPQSATFTSITIPGISAVPEPTSVLLLASVVIGLAAFRRRKFSARLGS